MRELVERGGYELCLALGRVLRAGRYATTRLAERDGVVEVHKRRLLHAPLLVWLGAPLARLLDTGVQVLGQREWEEREQRLHLLLRGATVRVEGRGTLVLPRLPGRTLASLLEDPTTTPAARDRAVELATVALAGLHRRGVTHADAMAENVMIDLDAGVAHWFDFETVHDARRPPAWRRADDLRALLTTCLLRTASDEIAGTLQRIVDVYSDPEVIERLAASSTAIAWRRLPFHLGQAGLSYQRFRQVARLLQSRTRPPSVPAGDHGASGAAVTRSTDAGSTVTPP